MLFFYGRKLYTHVIALQGAGQRRSAGRESYVEEKTKTEEKT